MSVFEEGRQGEQMAREFLKAHGYSMFQPDWLALPCPDCSFILNSRMGQYLLIETKNQYLYDDGIFQGHGLPPNQTVSRLIFQERTGVIATLLIHDKGTKKWYWQRLDILENSDYILTPGVKRVRKIYPLSAFIELPPLEGTQLPIGERI